MKDVAIEKITQRSVNLKLNIKANNGTVTIGMQKLLANNNNDKRSFLKNVKIIAVNKR